MTNYNVRLVLLGAARAELEPRARNNVVHVGTMFAGNVGLEVALVPANKGA